MTSDDQGGKTTLSVEEIAAEARPLAAQADFGKMAERFLASLQSWAAPSAVLCLCKDPAAEGGWRSIADLAFGPVSPAFERSIVKLIEDSAPGSLSRPVPVRPRDDAGGAGVKVRDNWLVPWAHGELGGYVFIRGISHSISNFGDAVALLSQALWPRLPGSPAAAVAVAAPSQLPTLVEQARVAAERLTEALRAERLVAPGGEQASGPPDLSEKLAAMETTRAALAVERDKAVAEVAALQGRLAEVEARTKAPGSGDQLNTLRRRVNELEGQAAELSERLSEATKARREIESERDGARAEAVALRGKLAEASARPQSGSPSDQDALAKRVSELEERQAELSEKLAVAGKARVELEAERDAARREALDLKGRLDQLQAKADAPNEQLTAAQKRVSELTAGERELTERLAAAEKARAELESERDAARAERAALEGRLAEAQAKANAGDAAAEVEELKKRVGELEGRANELSEKSTAAEKARAELEAERDALRAEASGLKSKVAALESQGDGDMHWEPVASEEVETLQRRLADLDSRYNEAEKGRLEVVAERDRLRTEIEAAKAANTGEGGEAGGEGELSRAKAEANRLWQTVESLQQQLQKEAERLSQLATENTRLTQAAEDAKRERDAAQASLIAASEGVQDAERRERSRVGQRGKLIESFQATADALRRTPFVPPALRIAFSGVEEVLAGEGETRERPAIGRASGRVLFLDRDIAGVERIASELEAAGLEVLIAHYPEEVGFFLKTPDARKLTAMVCDVMAFRGDQNLLDLFRAWRQDQSNLALLLSFKADSPAETEKAQRIPVVLTAGYLTRPLDRQAVLDAVGMIARRQGTR